MPTPLETMFESFAFDVWMDGEIWCDDSELGIVLNAIHTDNVNFTGY